MIMYLGLDINTFPSPSPSPFISFTVQLSFSFGRDPSPVRTYTARLENQHLSPPCSHSKDVVEIFLSLRRPMTLLVPNPFRNLIACICPDLDVS